MSGDLKALISMSGDRSDRMYMSGDRSDLVHMSSADLTTLGLDLRDLVHISILSGRVAALNRWDASAVMMGPPACLKQALVMA